MNAKGLIGYWNAQAERILGWSRAGVIGRSLADTMIPARYTYAHERRLKKFLDTAEEPVWSERIEKTALRRKGHEFPFELAIAATKLLGEPTFSAFVPETSERKRGEVARRESEEHLRFLLTSTGQAIYGVDLEGNCTFCSPAFVRLLGYQSTDDFFDKDMHALIHHTRRDGSPYPLGDCPIYQAFRQGKASHVTDDILWRADGTSFAAEYWSYPVLRQGEVIGFAATFLDITERKRGEQRLLKAKETAELATRSKGEFLANNGHETHTPVNAVLGMTDLTLDTKLTGEQCDYLSIVHASAESLLKIINDILHSSGMETRNAEPETPCV